jgi:hypothetical protein
MTLYRYSTGAVIRELTADEAVEYLQMIKADWTHTGVVLGDRFGVPGEAVHAI